MALWYRRWHWKSRLGPFVESRLFMNEFTESSYEFVFIPSSFVWKNMDYPLIEIKNSVVHSLFSAVF